MVELKVETSELVHTHSFSTCACHLMHLREKRQASAQFIHAATQTALPLIQGERAPPRASLPTSVHCTSSHFY